MSNIIDSIKLSGTVYTLSAQTEGGGVPESTFTAYTASTNERISQDEEVTAAALNVLNESLSGKQDTLSAGTNITISGNVISAEGGGKAIEAGRGITVTTGETADTVSFNLAIYDRGKTSVSECHGENSNVPICSSNFCHLEQPSGSIGSNSNSSHKEGAGSKIGNNSNNSHVEGFNCEVGTNSPFSHAEGQYTKTSNQSEHASGQYNASSRASSTFGNSGNTLFSVGNGTSNSARHNAFEIRQNGDIYLTSGGTDIKLQDHLGGGGSVTVDTELDSGSTNPVENRVIYNKIDEVEQVTAAGLNALNDKITPTVELTQAQYDALVTAGTVSADTYYIITDAQAGDLTNYYTKTETNTLLGGKQATLVSGTNIKTINNESILGSGNIDIQGGGGTVDPTLNSGSTNAVANSAITTAINTVSGAIPTTYISDVVEGHSGTRTYLGKKMNGSNIITWMIGWGAINGTPIAPFGNQKYNNFSLVETSAITTSITSSSTDAEVPSAKAVYDKLGGLSLVKLTQSAYDLLPTKDPSTLYVIVD